MVTPTNVNQDDARAFSTSTMLAEGLPVSAGAEVDIDVVVGAVSGRQPVAPRAGDGGPARPVAVRLPPVPAGPPTVPHPEQAAAWRSRATMLVQEATAAGAKAAVTAAPLWVAAGRIHELDLGEPLEAATRYEAAFRADPTYVPALHAARRLFAMRGLWRAVVLLLDAELRLPGAPTVALRLEKARVLEARLGRPLDALDEYRAVLAAEPAHGVAVDAVVRALTRARRHDVVVDVLMAAADAAGRAPLQAAWLVQAAHLCEAKLADDARAVTLLERAALLLPGQRVLLETLRRLYARRGQASPLAGVLEQLARSASTDAEAAALWTEHARVLLGAHDVDRSTVERAAIAALEQARARAPGDPIVLDDLGHLYERRQDWASLADVIEARADAAHNLRGRADLLADAARVAEERLGDQERAIRLYRRSAELAPGDGEVLASLGRLFARMQQFDDLSLVYDQQIAALADPQQKLPLLFEHAELLAFSLDDAEGALLRLRELVDIVPGDIAANRLASTLCARLERWDDLVQICEAQLLDGRGAFDRAARLDLLQRVAEVHEDHRGDLALAAATYERMLALEPGTLPVVRTLSRLYGALERWDDVLRTNAAEAEIVEDTNVVVSLWVRNGEVLAEKLGRIDEAIESFQRALTLMPMYLPALKALGALYARAGRWTDLVAMHRQEAEVARSRPLRTHLLFQIARLTLDKLGDVDAAASAFHDVLAEDPAHHASLHALEQIAWQRKDPVAVLAAHDRALAITSEAVARAQLRCRIADHLESALGRTDDAIAALEAALVEDPTLLAAHEQLIALVSRYGRHATEAAARERVHPLLPGDAARVANLRTLLSLYQHHADDFDRAAEAASRLLAVAGEDRAALRALLTCAMRRDDMSAAVDAAARLAAVEPSSDEVVNLHVQLAAWREALKPAQDSLGDWLRVLEFQPHHPVAARAVERAYVAAGAWDALFALYEQQAAALHEPRLIVDNAMKCGQLAEDRRGRPDVARACYERALAVARDHLPAIARLKDLYGREGRQQDQLRLTVLHAEAVDDPAQVVPTLLEVGAALRDRFGDVDAAADCYRRVLARDPRHREAYVALEVLWSTHGRFTELAGLYERSAAVLPAEPSTTAERAGLLRRAAQIHHERLGSLDAAAQLLERVRDLTPNDAAALTALGLVRGARDDWAGAIEAFAAALPVATDPLEVGRLHLQLGTIFVGHRVDGARAVIHLKAALATLPQNRPAQALLARAYELAGAPADARATWADLLPLARSDAERRGLHLTVARLAELAGELARAARHVDAAVALTAPGEVAQALFDRGAALFERAGDAAGLLEATLRRADAVLPFDGQAAAALLVRAARLQADGPHK
ncbi:MAG: hypothetical protein FJ137_14600, partial [Deltaproteobacteria bacterium]|nr:hypothetical protein [Deltaproteobacteria bacterium]